MANETSRQHSSDCPVNSWNEWDPLEEVIVGTPVGAHVHFSEANPLKVTSPNIHCDPSGDLSLNSAILRAYDGTPFPPEVVRPTFLQIENFVHILRREGVTVRRPDPFNLATPISTPHWQERAGHNFMNPSVTSGTNTEFTSLVIGHEIRCTSTSSSSPSRPEKR